MPPQRRTKLKRAGERPSRPAPEDSPPENPRVPSGHPFIAREVVVVCNFSSHWATLLIDLKRQKLILYDPKAWSFDDHHRENRRSIFLPMARVIPQIMKKIEYFQHNNVRVPQYTQWELCFAASVGKNAYRQKDGVSCALYSLKYDERLVSKEPGDKGLRNQWELEAYCERIAKTIFCHSTDEATLTDLMAGLQDG